MPSLRDDITKTLHRFSRRGSSPHARAPEPPQRRHVQLGTVIGQYTVDKKLGSGGMGDVYLARDAKLGRQVALKFLPREWTAEPIFLRRFQQEARTASALNHPNILTIYDFCEIDGDQIIISEFVEGVTLRAAIEKDLLDLPTALEIVRQIASALVAAHCAGIIHRDLKPGNVMLRPDGYVKVIDFGLAKLSERLAGTSRQEWTRAGAVLGTAGYMSPEQARGEEVDERTDIWSLGVLLYELVAKQSPFEGKTDNHLIVAILDDPPRVLPNAEQLPAGLAAVIATALEKDRKKRFQTARDFLAALAGVQLPGGSASRTFSVSFAPQSRNPRRWFLPIAIALTLIAATSVWWYALGGRWKVLGPAWFDIGTVERITYDGGVQLATLAPNGDLLAYATVGSNGQTLHIRKLKERSETTLRPSENSYDGLTFSPDSRTLFYVVRLANQEHGVLYSVPVDSAGRTPAALMLDDIDGAITFSPDGGSFVFLRRSYSNTRTEAVMIADTSNAHDVRPLVSLPQTSILPNLSWLPKRNRIVAILYPVRVGQPSQPLVAAYSPDGKLREQYSLSSLRTLRYPASLDGGNLLIFAGRIQSALQKNLVQLFLPTGEFLQLAPDMLTFDELSASADGKTIAAVRSDNRASVWVADPKQPQSAVRWTPTTENYDALAWLPDGKLAVSSSRSGNVDLAALDENGKIEPLGNANDCIQMHPSVAPGSSVAVYSSNCAHGGDSFNIWRLDLRTGDHTPLTSGPNLDSDPDAGHDGQWVVYTSSPSGLRTLWKVPLTGGEPSEVTSLEASHPFLSPAGTEVLCRVRAPKQHWRTVVLDLATGSAARELPDIPAQAFARWSPDGHAIDYVKNGNGRSEIWRHPLDAAAPPSRLLSVPEELVTYFSWNADGTRIAYLRARSDSDVVLFHRNTHH